MANKFAVTALVAALTLGGGWFAYQNFGGTSGNTVESDREGWFLPELRGKLNDVRRIEFMKGDAVVRLQSDGSSWTATDYGGYALRFDSVREFLLQVASLKDAQKKTSSPSRHAELGLAAVVEAAEDPRAYGAPQPSTLLKLWTDGTEPELALWIGRGKWQPSQGVYVRLDGDDQCWAAAGQLRPVEDAKRWMDTNVVSMAAADVASVAITGDLPTTILRPDAETDFSCDATVPEGREWKPVNAFTAITSSLSFTNFENVELASAERYQSAATRTITWTSFDGAAIVAELWQVEGGCWARFSGDEYANWGYYFGSAKADVWLQNLDAWTDEIQVEESAESTDETAD
ncbi:MAG: DUF4340 domain-containing protein [Planctomycetes bacterium]|nr:DUF4340 domain-containing protein [Planctomycetota bacterium]